MNLPADWHTYLRRCPRGHLWHESEGGDCTECADRESALEAKRKEWPLGPNRVTLCPDWPPDDGSPCGTCGWPSDLHMPF